MEIERKFTVRALPDNLSSLDFHLIEQAYLCTEPVVRVRRQGESCYMTYKGKGMLAHEEYNLPLTADSYEHLLSKSDGNIITKTRYLIPIKTPSFMSGFEPTGVETATPLTVELDVFGGRFNGLVVAELEFPTVNMAQNYIPESWFLDDVTSDDRYHNSFLSNTPDPEKLVLALNASRV